MPIRVRKTHVRRVWREVEPEGGGDPERDEDVWVDLQRINEMVVYSGQGPDYQQTTYHLFWNDPDDPNEANPTRQIIMSRVYNPEDEEQYIDVPSIKRMNTVEHGRYPDIPGAPLRNKTRAPMGQRNFRRFRQEIEDPDVNSRKKGLVRIPHREVTSEPDENGFFPGEYVFEEGSEDESNYVDQELILKFYDRSGQGPDYQFTTNKLSQEFLVENIYIEIDSRDGDAPPPARLDPFQNIVNVNWGGSLFCVSVRVTRILEEETQTAGPYACSPSTGIASGNFGHISLILARWEVLFFRHLARPRAGGSWDAAEIVPVTGFTQEEDGDYQVSGYPKDFPIDEWQFVGGDEDQTNPNNLKLWESRFNDLDGSNYLVNGQPVESPTAGVFFKNVTDVEIQLNGWHFTTGPTCQFVETAILTAQLPDGMGDTGINGYWTELGTEITRDTLSCGAFRFEIDGRFYKPVAAAKVPISDQIREPRELFLLLEPV